MTDHVENLANLTERYRAARKQLEDARAGLIEGLKTAAGDGMRQADMIRAIDHEWTREHVRKVLANDSGPSS